MPFDYKKEYERYRRYYQSLEPEFKKPAARAYTAIIFSFLAISLFAWYAIRPTMQTIFTLKREISDQTDIDKRMEDKISALIGAQAAYQNIEADLPIIAQALPENSDAVRALFQLQSLAQDTHVVVSGISLSGVPLAPETAPTAKRTTVATTSKLLNFPLSLSITGNYGDIKNFLAGIQNLRRIIQINSMSFTPQRESGTVSTASAKPAPAATSTQIKLDLKLTVFYLST